MFFVFSFEVFGLRFVRQLQECAQQRKILRSAPSALAALGIAAVMSAGLKFWNLGA